MSVKKFKEYLNESVVSESEIKEYAIEETERLFEDLYEKMAKKFPIDGSELDNDDKILQDKIIKDIANLVSKITINNISYLKK